MSRRDSPLLECVINVSEGRDTATLADLAEACSGYLLDVHSDSDHHRSVFTLAGPARELAEAARSLARQTVVEIDLRRHQGVHPRLGALDVVPWVSLTGWPVTNGPVEPAREARDDFARWAGAELGLPCFLYGPDRSLPDVRRHAWRTLRPDTGPPSPHPSAGASAVGVRPILVAYNLWLVEADLALARKVAAAIRGPRVRTLALVVGNHVQVSCNLIDPWLAGPDVAFDAVARRASIDRAELVGLAPQGVLASIPEHRWQELGLDPATTIEARLEQAGLDGGSFPPR